MSDVLLTTLPEIALLALTMWGEARSEPIEGQIAVGCVIRNRVQHTRGATYTTICLAPAQFSCWNDDGTANHHAVLTLAQALGANQPIDDPTFDESRFLAAGVLSGALRDRTGGARNYYAPDAMIPPGRVPTAAIGRPMVTIGSQRFYTAV